MRRVGLFATLATLAACSSIPVTSDWDQTLDFSQFKTFVLMDEQPQAVNRLIVQRISAAIIADLTSKGFRQVETLEQADLAVDFAVTTENRTSFRTVHEPWGVHGWGYSRARWGAPQGVSRTTQRDYTVGTLIIAAFQTGDKELVWEGSGSRTINIPSNPNQSEEKINDSVRQIMQSLPPEAPSGS